RIPSSEFSILNSLTPVLRVLRGVIVILGCALQRMAHRLIFHFRSFMQLVNDVKPRVNGKFSSGIRAGGRVHGSGSQQASGGLRVRESFEVRKIFDGAVLRGDRDDRPTMED